MRKLPAPAPIDPPKKEPPKERKPLIVETKGFDEIAKAMIGATKAQGEATAALREAVDAVVATAVSTGAVRSYEVEIIRDLSGIMTKLIVTPSK